MSKATKRKYELFFPENEIRRREMGFKCKLGWEQSLKYSLYTSLRPCNSWDPVSSSSNKSANLGVHHGGIFNLEFSPDGKQLVAACEQQAIMIFDSLTKKQICDVKNAHSSCVNGIKFLDNRVFATCSDDKTVALWDVRNLKRKISHLFGHNNWVKNIEYSSEEGLLVTSGFDGRILGWNINRYTEKHGQCSELFKMEGLMRMRLTPDSSKLIICTTGGCIVIVHDLCLRNLSEDLKNFEPDYFRLLEISSSFLPQSDNLTDVFYRKRNRIEFISDFPPGNDAEVIHSLQVHPQAWCVLSRNTSTGDSSEWTCVHDIQDMEVNKRYEESTESEQRKGERRYNIASSRSNRTRNERRASDREFEIEFRPLSRTESGRRENSESESGNSGDHPEIEIPVSESQSTIPTLSDRENETNSRSEETSSLRQNFQLRRLAIARLGVEDRRNFRDILFIQSITNSVLLLHPRNNFNLQTCSIRRRPLHIRGSVKSRLTNYIEEPNKGKGFIKELCFSSDGRVICSPYDCGVRLLMFNESCSELSHCVQPTPQQLHVISTNICHNSCVVSTKFSPVDSLLVSGCLNGKIVWHQPII